MNPGSRSFARRVEDPDDQPALVAALGTAGGRLHAASTPDPAFQAALRTRLLAVASVAAAPTPPARRRAPAGRRLALALTLVVAALVIGVVGIGAGRSLPGQPLYVAKRATEAVQVFATRDPVDKGVRHLHLAEARLREVQALSQGRRTVAGSGRLASAAGGRADTVRRTLAAMDDETRTGSALIDRAATRAGDTAPIALLEVWSGQQAQRIRAVVPTIPEPARERAEASLSLIDGVRAAAGAKLGPR